MNTKAIGAAAGLAAAGAAGVAFYGGQYPTAQIYGPTICRNPGAGRRICLTYDDGPNPVYTPKLMEILDRFGAKATFFSIGMWVEREPELLREVHAAGHAIGNHTFTHPTMPMLSSAEVKDEMRRCRAAVEAAGLEFSRGPEGMLMRPAVRPPAAGHPEGRPRGGLRARHLVGHLLRLAPHRDPAIDRPPRRARRRGRHHPHARRQQPRAGRRPLALRRGHRGHPQPLRGGGIRVRHRPRAGRSDSDGLRPLGSTPGR